MTADGGFVASSQSLIEGLPFPAMVLDGATRVCGMNRLMEALTGFSTERVRGHLAELVLRSDIGHRRGGQFDQVLSQGEPVSIAGDILNHFRQKIPVQYHISKVQATQGAGWGLLVVLEDISSRPGSGQVNTTNFSSIELIGNSPKMQRILDMIPLMAHTDASVLITGETGTGKDKIAEIIHRESDRARAPFIKINCGALPLGLLESELFGHVKGAFTGATRNKPGMFKLADRGTLFLTEVGDMPLHLQVKLLAVLDDMQFTPVGGEQTISVDVRIIAATHRPLQEQVKKNKFRQDLFYRLNVLHVHMPPLRERGSDIGYLIDFFLDKYSNSLNKAISGFTPAAMQILLDYAYPGNVRELSNIVEYAVNVCKKQKIGKEQLPLYLFDKTVLESAQPVEQERPVVMEKPESSWSTAAAQVQGGSWADIERQMVVNALSQCQGNRTLTAEQLGWGRMKLWRKMKKYGLLE